MPSQINNQYADEAQSRWPEQYAQSERNLAKLNDQEKRQLFDLGKQITAQIAQLFETKFSANSAEVQAQIGNHYRWLCQFWTPTADTYRGMGEMYAADERFTAYYDGFAVGLAPFMSEAMTNYAARNL